LLAGGALAAVLLGATLAQAQGANGVTFSDVDTRLIGGPGAAIDLSVQDDADARFSLAPPERVAAAAPPRRLELAMAAGGEDSPLDVSIAQRATLGSDSNGDISRRGRGSEVRVGRGLVEDRNGDARDRSSVYMFVASDDEALTWQPGARSDFGGQGSSFGLQDQVEVGDMSAGVTYERNGVQASLAYVEREVSTTVGRQSFTQDENFAGVTLTMRR
jgi:hypothetical protein